MMTYYEWFQVVQGCLQDMGAASYDETEARHLYHEGYEPAEAAMELMPEDDE